MLALVGSEARGVEFGSATASALEPCGPDGDLDDGSTRRGKGNAQVPTGDTSAPGGG